MAFSPSALLLFTNEPQRLVLADATTAVDACRPPVTMIKMKHDEVCLAWPYFVAWKLIDVDNARKILKTLFFVLVTSQEIVSRKCA